MNETPLETELRTRWQASRAALSDLRSFKKSLIATQVQLSQQRRAATLAGTLVEQSRNYFKIRFGELASGLRDCTDSHHKHLTQHRELCDEINSTLGAGTTRRWRIQTKPPTKHLAQLPPPAPTVPTSASGEPGNQPANTDEGYGQNGFTGYA